METNVSEKPLEVEKSALEKRAAAREDFIKRLFAVTLSVGIASQMSRVVFGQVGASSTTLHLTDIFGRWHQLLLLITSLLIIVSSWEGYLSAIQRLPLQDVGRFYVDIALVFSYLLLTLSVQFTDVWFSIHVFIFAEYFLWDILRELNPDYIPRTAPWYKQSKSITVIWLTYFSILLVIKLSFNNLENNVGFFIISISAFLGVIFYRADKQLHWDWIEKSQAFAPPIILSFTYGWLRVH